MDAGPASGMWTSGLIYVDAEDENDSMLIDQDIPRCQNLLQEMTTLSTTLQSSTTTLSTPVTLLRARATTLAFSLLPSATPRANDEDDDDDGEEEAEADPDVLPTILAYKDGELERNWIRVDWEIGDGTLEELLRRSVLCLALDTDFR